MPELRIYATVWGLVEDAAGPFPLAKLPALCAKLKSLGYSGIEIPIAFVMKYGSSKFEALMRALDMTFIAQVFSSGGPPTPGNLGIASEFGISHPKDSADTRDVAAHKAVWGAQVHECARLRAVLQSVNSHTGKDYFTDAESDDMLAHCVALEKETGLVINRASAPGALAARFSAAAALLTSPHACAPSPCPPATPDETHRARILYSPWQVPRVMAAHPALHFTADLSHFSVVTETGADDPEVCKVVAQLTPRTRHVHARVGFPEGPQVPSVTGPLWAPLMEGYMAWWRGVYQAALGRGDAVVSTCPEFGPAAYAWVTAHAPLNPGRKDTLNNVWATNHHVGQEVCRLFAELGGKAPTLAPDAEEGNWTLE